MQPAGRHMGGVGGVAGRANSAFILSGTSAPTVCRALLPGVCSPNIYGTQVSSLPTSLSGLPSCLLVLPVALSPS